VDNLEQLLLDLKNGLERNTAAIGNLERLVVDVKESLEREMGTLKQDMRQGFAEVKTRFDNQSGRLDRHGALLQTGSRWSTRMNAWAEKIDAALETKDRQIAELRERIVRLERKNGQ
jgi:hypothetical protein